MNEVKPKLSKTECCYNCTHWNKGDYYEQYIAFCTHHKINVECDDKCEDYEHDGWLENCIENYEEAANVAEVQ